MKKQVCLRKFRFLMKKAYSLKSFPMDTEGYILYEEGDFVICTVFGEEKDGIQIPQITDFPQHSFFRFAKHFIYDATVKTIKDYPSIEETTVDFIMQKYEENKSLTGYAISPQFVSNGFIKAKEDKITLFDIPEEKVDQKLKKERLEAALNLGKLEETPAVTKENPYDPSTKEILDRLPGVSLPSVVAETEKREASRKEFLRPEGMIVSMEESPRRVIAVAVGDILTYAGQVVSKLFK